MRPLRKAEQNQGITRNRKPFFIYKKFHFQPYFQPSREIKNRPKPVVLLLCCRPGEGSTVVPFFSDIVVVASDKIGYENFGADLDLDDARGFEGWWFKS